jgi:large subunit ribosomal protein L15
MPLHRRLPKRGFTNIFKTDYNEVNLGRVQQALDAGKLDGSQVITVDALVAAGVCAKVRDGVKLLGQGDFSAKVSFEVARASKTALAAIEKTGGSIKLLVVDAPVEA